MHAGIIFSAAIAVLEYKKKYKFISSNKRAEVIESELARLGVPRVVVGEKSTDEQKSAYFRHQHAMCLVNRVLKYQPDNFERLAHMAINEPNLTFPD